MLQGPEPGDTGYWVIRPRYRLIPAGTALSRGFGGGRGAVGALRDGHRSRSVKASQASAGGGSDLTGREGVCGRGTRGFTPGCHMAGLQPWAAGLL